MPKCVCSGAQLQCSSGASPSALVILPKNRVNEVVPAANIMDFIPVTNIPPFGMCLSTANPAVAAATSAATTAALGVYTFTPAPCLPATTSPWVNGNSTVLLASAPILTDDSTLTCSYGGSISITQPGQSVVEA